MYVFELDFPFPEAKEAHVAVLGMPPYIQLATESDYTVVPMGDMPICLSQLPEVCREELKFICTV